MKTKLILSLLCLLTVTPPLIHAISAEDEVQLKNLTPAVKSVTVNVQASEREAEVVETLRNMVRQILDNAKLGVVRIPIQKEPTTSPAIKVYEHIAMLIEIDTAAPPDTYTFQITLQEAEQPKRTQMPSASFTYTPSQYEETYAAVKTYLTESLNLEPRRQTSTPDTPEGLPLSEISNEMTTTQNAMTANPSPSSENRDNNDTSSTNHNTPQHPLTTHYQVSQQQPENAAKEVQLQNISPAVKTISVKLQGATREQSTLQNIQEIVVNILEEAELQVKHIPTAQAPQALPANKAFERINLLIHAIAPETPKQPYQITIVLQKQGEEAQSESFAYFPEDQLTFYDRLQQYLNKKLNLK